MSTSARRPTNYSDASSTSFARTNMYRPTNIPFTAKKANLFTPQAKKPYQTGQSTNKSYLSTGVATEKKKSLYQRPLKPMPDKDEQLKMFNRLVECMKANAPHLPLPDQKKFFSSVSTTESTRIFEFLIGRLLPDFQISRLEIDVPEALTMLDYPYIRAVTKSALVSVTTRQAVVGLLNIFDWLIKSVSHQPTQENLVKQGESVDVDLELVRNLRLYSDRIEEANQELADRLWPLHDFGAKELEEKRLSDECDRIAADIEVNKRDYEEVQELKKFIEDIEEYKDQATKYIEVKHKAKDDVLKRNNEVLAEESSIAEKLAAIRVKTQTHPLEITELERLQTIDENLTTKIAEKSREVECLTNQASKIDRENRTLEDRLHANVESKCFQIKSMIELFESQDIQSETLANNRQMLIDCLKKLQQPLPKSASQVIELIKEVEVFLQGLEATRPSLESELQDELTKKNLELNDLQATIHKITGEIDQTERANLRVKQKIDLIEAQHEEEVKKLESLIVEEDRKASDLQREHESRKATCDTQLVHELQVLSNDKKTCKAISELEDARLREVIEGQNCELQIMLKIEEDSLHKWQSVLNTCESNRRGLSLVRKRLKKRQIIRKQED